MVEASSLPVALRFGLKAGLVSCVYTGIRSTTLDLGFWVIAFIHSLRCRSFLGVDFIKDPSSRNG